MARTRNSLAGMAARTEIQVDDAGCPRRGYFPQCVHTRRTASLLQTLQRLGQLRITKQESFTL